LAVPCALPDGVSALTRFRVGHFHKEPTNFRG
jgi:hypothetical protein